MIAIRDCTKASVNEGNQLRRDDTVKQRVPFLHKEASYLLGGWHGRFDAGLGDGKVVVDSRHTIVVNDDHRFCLMCSDEIVQYEVLMTLDRSNPPCPLRIRAVDTKPDNATLTGHNRAECTRIFVAAGPLTLKNTIQFAPSHEARF